jgi:hypothetical protein
MSLFKNLFNRVQNYQKNLEYTELFVDKPWALVNEENEALCEYEFYRDGKLMVSKQGLVSWGTWEATPATQRLVISNEGFQKLFNNKFYDDVLMMFWESGSPEKVMVFVNQSKLPDLMYQNYLRTLEESKKPQIRPLTEDEKWLIGGLEIMNRPVRLPERLKSPEEMTVEALMKKENLSESEFRAKYSDVLDRFKTFIVENPLPGAGSRSEE